MAANPKTRSKEDKATLKNLGINPEAQGSAMAHKSLTKQPQAAKPPAKQPAAPKTPTQTPAAPTVDTTGDTDKLSDADWKLMGMGGGKKKIAKARALSDKDLAAKTPAAPVKPVTPAAPKKRDDKVYYESKNKLFTTNNKKGNSTMKISRKKIKQLIEENLSLNKNESEGQESFSIPRGKLEEVIREHLLVEGVSDWFNINPTHTVKRRKAAAKKAAAAKRAKADEPSSLGDRITANLKRWQQRAIAKKKKKEVDERVEKTSIHHEYRSLLRNQSSEIIED